MNRKQSSLSLPQSILKRATARGRGWAFTPHDYADLGDPRGVGMALTRLVREGKIRRVARGVYDLPHPHPVLGKAGAGTDAVVAAIARGRQLRILPSPQVAANQLGLSEQVPAQVVYQTDGAAALIRLGKLSIRLRRNSGRSLALAGRASGTVAQALRAVGKDRVTEATAAHLRDRLDVKARQQLAQDIHRVPAWMRRVFQQVIAGDGN